MNEDLLQKFEKLKTLIGDARSAVVAFSGGVDSTLLTKVTADVLGQRMIAVTAKSETFADRELEFALSFAREHEIPHRVIHTSELSLPHFAANPTNRCYYCKKELYSRLAAVRAELGLDAVLDGSNADDLRDYRPGMRAVKELKARMPLLEAGLRKTEIRTISEYLGLSTSNKPTMACLSSRFPYGTAITPERLRMIETAETVIRDQGLRQLRVRYHGEIARIEIDPDQFSLLLEHRLEITAKLKQAGFKYVVLDIEGYRTGSMNETLTL